ncbi:MAG: carbohydrate ABC transporter permease, partial [Gemmobacter sp.]
MPRDLTRIASPDKPETERNWWVHVILLVVCVIAMLPVVWMVMTAFMPRDVAKAVPPQWLFPPTLDAFRMLIFEQGMLGFLKNSLIVSVSSTLLSVTIGMFCAYALARFEFAGKEDVSFWILTNRMMPAVAVILPMFLIFKTLNLLD